MYAFEICLNISFICIERCTFMLYMCHSFLTCKFISCLANLLYIDTPWNKEKNRIGHQDEKMCYEQKQNKRHRLIYIKES